MHTPVLFLIFNRPDVTQRVFEEIRKAQPQYLYIAADGPREGKEGEYKKCEQARSITNQIDWKCEVKTLFRDKNLGCRDAVSSAITWFFTNVEEGIILEDDCLPSQPFFIFCEELLEKYRSNEQVMHIAGSNFQKRKQSKEYSYYFSNYSQVWGWASWRRSWKKYSANMNGFDEFVNHDELYKLFNNRIISDFHQDKLQKTFDREIDTWDYQWTYCIWRNKGISIIPEINLIENIGFNYDATHTKDSVNISNPLNMETLIIKHPENISVNIKADEDYFWRLYGYKNKYHYYSLYIRRKILHRLFLIKNYLK